jgi:hypothetical protein
LVTFAHSAGLAVIELRFPLKIIFMENLIFYLIVQLNLIFGVAGLMWPDKLMPVFGLLMFPWPASHRAIRTHGFVAIVGYLLVLGKILFTIR